MMNESGRTILLWALFLSGVLTGLIIAEFIFYMYTNNSFATFAQNFKLHGLLPKQSKTVEQTKEKKQDNPEPANIFEDYPLEQVTDFVITTQNNQYKGTL